MDFPYWSRVAVLRRRQTRLLSVYARYFPRLVGRSSAQRATTSWSVPASAMILPMVRNFDRWAATGVSAFSSCLFLLVLNGR